jgi:hypothetical protein
MMYRNATPTDSYPSPDRELRAALVPLRTALLLSATLVLGLAASGYGV